jgi:MoxR-like ATPase
MVRAKRQTARRRESFSDTFESIAANIEKVIEGKPEVIRLALTALFAEGHLLIEDMPGVGKTMLAKAMAKSTSCTCKRVQFTPDLLPSDVIGVSVYDGRAREFEFKPGPVFSNIVLGDEINRASPKTQSALLEAMEEHQVTVDGTTHALPPPFMVIATQNPIEYEGTYPLPESQLDRFMMRISIGYPAGKSAVDILDHHGTSEPVEVIGPVIDTQGVLDLIEGAKATHVADTVKRYIVELVEATRTHPGVYLGASPRASLFLLKAARAHAASQGREFVLPDDVKEMALPVFEHRLLPTAEAQVAGTAAAQVVEEVLEQVAAPAHTRPER